jgi:hypothetical protein
MQSIFAVIFSYSRSCSARVILYTGTLQGESPEMHHTWAMVHIASILDSLNMVHMENRTITPHQVFADKTQTQLSGFMHLIKIRHASYSNTNSK